MKFLPQNRTRVGVVLFLVGVIVGVGGFWLANRMWQGNLAIGNLVKLNGTIASIHTTPIADDPETMTVKLDSGQTVTTDYDCGYTTGGIGDISAGLKVGTHVQIHGKVTSTNRIDVCYTGYYIHVIPS